MATNIVELVQQNLGDPVLQKIDPNMQEAKEPGGRTTQQKLAQAAIPAVLAGFFKFTRTDKGCQFILTGGSDRNWLDIIFGADKASAVEKVAHYAGTSRQEAATKMEEVGRESVILIHQMSGSNATVEKMMGYMREQRHHILVCLPAAMQLGGLLNNDSLDDRTNKMEGPVSNLMHKIEDKFGSGS